MPGDYAMIRPLAVVTAIVVASFATQAKAVGSVTNVTVTELSLDTNSSTGATLAWVHFSANVGGSRPACITSGWGNELAFDPTTPKGKALFSLLQSAFLSGKPVDAAGIPSSPMCTAMAAGANAETLGYVKMHN
jgi:hypothetical protein